MLFEFPDVDGTKVPTFTNTYLNNKRVARLRNRMSYWLSRQPSPPSPAEFQAELNHQAVIFIFDDEPDADGLMTEAIELASDVIRRRLSEADLPPPKSIADHARQLVDADSSFLTAARQRLEARAAANAESIHQLVDLEAL